MIQIAKLLAKSAEISCLLLEKSPSVQFSSVTQTCPTLCDPMYHSTPGLPVHHQLLELTQTHAHWVSDAIQPSHPRSFPSPPAPNPSSTLLMIRFTWKWKSLQSGPTLCDYTVHENLQARILEWVAFPFSRGSAQPRDWTQVSHIARGFFTSWTTREAQEYWSG